MPLQVLDAADLNSLSPSSVEGAALSQQGVAGTSGKVSHGSKRAQGVTASLTTHVAKVCVSI